MVNAGDRVIGDFIYRRKQWLGKGDNPVIIMCGHGVVMRSKLVL